MTGAGNILGSYSPGAEKRRGDWDGTEHVESAFDKREMKHNIVTNDAINTRKARPEMRGSARTQTIECT